MDEYSYFWEIQDRLIKNLKVKMKFRKKPIVIEAEQFHPEGNIPEGVKLRSPTFNPFGEIDTLGETMLVFPGDWVITEVNGEKYPCKPDIFENTYEPI